MRAPTAALALGAWTLAPFASAAGTPAAPPRVPDLPYEVVDGMAIHAGDIVLGPAEEFRGHPRPGGPPGATPKAIALFPSGVALWPAGRVPYVIDENLPAAAAESVLSAIEEWNARTVITVVPRTDEEDFVRFAPSASCSSPLGRRGGEQRLSSAAHCGHDGMVHEIGHAVGLGHEHQRADRDARLAIYASVTLHGQGAQWVAPWWAPERPYDYRSAMHYNPPTFETIPPGIEIPSKGLSEGDIDGVARLYGQPPRATVIATNPPGLEVLVDGIPTTTPAKFEWAPGSGHTLEVAVQPQERDGSRYLFARWNDGGPRARKVAASPGRTWIEAHFIAQRRVTASSSPPASGEVLVSPGSDGWITLRAPVRIEARALPGSAARFSRWNRWYPHGLAENPAELVTGPEPLDVVAYFATSERFRIGSNAGAFTLYLDGRWHRGPTVVLPSQAPAQVRVPETQRIRYEGGRYRFSGWSDGAEEPERTLSSTPPGGSLDVLLATEWPLEIVARPPHGGSVSADPPATDWHYAAGTETTVTAAPAAGWEFAGWSGDLAGGATTIARMDAPRTADAWFTQTRELRPGEPVEIASPSSHGYRFRAGTAAELALSFTPAPGSQAAALYVRAVAGPLEWGAQSWDRLFAAGSDVPRRRAQADFIAEPGAAPQRIVLSRRGTRPLRADALYFVTLAGSIRPVAGTLSLEASGTAADPARGKAWPRAFTFVAPSGRDPVPQLFELTNEGRATLRFEASSEAAWLTADPPQGSIPPGEAAQLSVRVTSTAAPDTYTAELDLALSAAAGAPAALALPVTFIAVPVPAPETAPD